MHRFFCSEVPRRRLSLVKCLRILASVCRRSSMPLFSLPWYQPRSSTSESVGSQRLYIPHQMISPMLAVLPLQTPSTALPCCPGLLGRAIFQPKTICGSCVKAHVYSRWGASEPSNWQPASLTSSWSRERVGRRHTTSTISSSLTIPPAGPISSFFDLSP